MSKKSIRTKSPHIHRPSKSNTIQEHPDRKRIPSPLPQFPKSKTISATPPSESYEETETKYQNPKHSEKKEYSQNQTKKNETWQQVTTKP